MQIPITAAATLPLSLLESPKLNSTTPIPAILLFFLSLSASASVPGAAAAEVPGRTTLLAAAVMVAGPGM